MGELRSYVLGGKRHRVTAETVIAHTPHGDKYLYRGDILPERTFASQVDRLLKLGMIEEAS